MYPKSWKRQFMEVLFLLFAFSYVVHRAGAWLGSALPVVLALMLLAGVFTLLFRGWRR